ncbi:hypothetical protein PHYBLDRAFT_166804 [Phycomyces blakesleeanus NRRL 1555(-)]|uniref:Uncharacterized protein n=1 Tax=Phycomyces blakesleeanus (strain ATCC 8743b / DSM 1359 / FGSC 10004 / NBRC 33097 / NRRL 1555) TaxID=763407 RepID=A0A162UE24_PHYB8|nr:hypothetical protein PHYBLDRAFT_166804 [Phycomyces blakesleeanus NRRL 1555(-)]OAD75572.1 hypothetical protein PHYBLDRAFT_166804 [Phycomyces blakesleeanus NRRL 1555(-)]|eukprot:XP_018293612.1 hypothetical protein PHYBLDRAFT_166804 [Phycomyces blakesleeanus NRRL 1555(-)]
MALCLQELFGLVALANEAKKIWILLKALHPEIAYEVEKSGLPHSWDKLVCWAAKVEAVKEKYHYSDLRLVPKFEDALSELIQEFRSMKIYLFDTCHFLPQASGSFRFGLSGFGGSGPCGSGFDTAVNMVETTLVYAAKHARVVNLSSSKNPYTHNKGKAVDKTHLYAQGQLNTFPTNDIYMTLAPDLSPPIGSSPLAPKSRYLHPPPRELPVHISCKDVWERLKSVDADDWETQSLETNAANLNSDSKLDGYNSNSTVYNYHYNYKDFASSQPLRALITINGQVIPAIFDLSASVSIISKALALCLGLVPNVNRLPFSSLDGQAHPPAI